MGNLPRIKIPILKTPLKMYLWRSVTDRQLSACRMIVEGFCVFVKSLLIHNTHSKIIVSVGN